VFEHLTEEERMASAARVQRYLQRFPELPQLFAYVQDNDLWKHALPDSKAFSAGLAGLGLDLGPQSSLEAAEAATATSGSSGSTNGRTSAVDVFEQNLQKLEAGGGVAGVVRAGTQALRLRTEEIDAELAAAFPVRIQYSEGAASSSSEGVPAGAAASSRSLHCLAVISTRPEYRSEAGNRLAEVSQARSEGEAAMAPVGCIAYVEAGMGAAASTHIKLSFRSIGDCDITPVCRAYGGGGHRNAASCIVPRTLFESWRVPVTPSTTTQ
jgi:hypothetical protein